MNQENNSFKQDLQKLGDRLRKMRIEKGYNNLIHFSDAIDISRALYSNYELGRGNVTHKNLIKILNGLKMSPKEFFSEGFE